MTNFLHYSKAIFSCKKQQPELKLKLVRYFFIYVSLYRNNQFSGPEIRRKDKEGTGMIRRTGLSLFILLNLICILYAQNTGPGQNHWPLKLYKDNYLITGVGDDQIKINLSIMYDVFFPNKIGLFIGYTQTMFWAAYSISSPFSEIDFNPDFFWRFELCTNRLL